MIAVTSNQVGAFTANWTQADDDRTPASAVRYEVHAGGSEDFVPSAATLVFSDAGVTSATITSGIEPGKKYFVRVAALDDLGARSLSGVLPVTVADLAAERQPGAVTQTLDAAHLVSVEGQTVTLTGDAPSPAVGSFISSSDANEGRGFLRKIVAVEQSGSNRVLRTEPAAINEVLRAVQVSGAFKMDALDPQGAASEQTVRARAQQAPAVWRKLDWAQTGFSYATKIGGGDGPQAQRVRPQYVASDGFIANNDSSQSGTWVQVAGESRIQISQGKSGASNLRLSILSNDIPWSSSSKVGICTVGIEVSGGDSDAGRANLEVSIGAEVVVAKDGERKTVVDFPVNFQAKTGSSASVPYRVALTARVDDVADGCNGDGLGLWREEVELVAEVFVTEEAFPASEATDQSFSSNASLKINNRIVTTFSPTVAFDYVEDAGVLTQATLKIQAQPQIEQTLTIDALAHAEIDDTKAVIGDRTFRKLYMTPAGIPIVISGVFRMDLRITGEATGELHATEKLNIGYDNISYGFEYRNGTFQPIQSASPVYELSIGGEGRARAKLKLTLLPSLEITTWEVLTGKVVLAPYLNSEAGIEGHVQWNAAVDFEQHSKLVTASDADYRLTKTYLGAGIDAFTYAHLKIWDTRIVVYPSESADPADYTTFEPFTLLAETPLMDLPTLTLTIPEGSGTRMPGDSRYIKVRGLATNVPNPLWELFPNILPQSFIRWQRWTGAQVVEQLGIPESSYTVIPDPDGQEGVFWVRLLQPAQYTLRVGGFSNWGSWARQYEEIAIDARDQNGNGIPDWWERRYSLAGTGSQVATADPDGDGRTNVQEWTVGTDPLVADTLGQINVSNASPTVGESISIWLSNLWAGISSVLVDFGNGVEQLFTSIVAGGTPEVSQAYGQSGPATIRAEYRNADGQVIGQQSLGINVGALAAVSSVAPAQTIRTFGTSFAISGSNLPISGVTVSSSTDPRISCQVPTNLTASGFDVGCTLYKMGDVPLNVYANGSLIGSVTVAVRSNVTGVSWARGDSGTYGTGTVYFNETITYKVVGENLLDDSVMGFAVEQCGVSNAEVGTPTSTARYFTCFFNDEAGAGAGQKAGVVKDGLGGQVLLDGWSVPVAVAPSSGKLPHTGITSSQCYQAGSNALVSCTSPEAIALSGDDKQDGMYTDVNSMSYSRVGSFGLDECVKDNVTGLMWEGKAASGTRAAGNRYTNWGDGRSGDASAYVAAVNVTGLCGYTDWRLPTVDELETLVDASRPYPEPTIRQDWFVNTGREVCWSSSPYVAYAYNAWYVNFGYGNVNSSSRDSSYPVRLVRASQ
ncbi:DUF1566 domain-containing protein [Ideonella sp.]|uniref:Lcl domain-containing protein n=1 Tax=Ideonella sp. TaxID=1929293 RepID=UPI003BB6ED09